MADRCGFTLPIKGRDLEDLSTYVVPPMLILPAGSSAPSASFFPRSALLRQHLDHADRDEVLRKIPPLERGRDGCVWRPSIIMRVARLLALLPVSLLWRKRKKHLTDVGKKSI